MRQLWLSDFPFVLSFAAGGAAAAALAALLVGVPALRLKGIYFSIGTLALAQALGLTVAQCAAAHQPLCRGQRYAVMTSTPRYYVAFGGAGRHCGVHLLAGRSKLGLGMMAVREDEAAARSIGINVFCIGWRLSS